jgi:hypothetical protein
LSSVSLFFSAAALANEVMTDRCSAEVAFPPHYDAPPNTKGTIVLQRDDSGRTEWTTPFSVQLSKDGHIRWWCHSTKGNAFDPGTWRVKDVNAEGVIKCLTGVGATVGAIAGGGSAAGAKDLAGCPKAVTIRTADFQGWTAERSRCDNHSTRIRARLGAGRLLQIECLGR